MLDPAIHMQAMTWTEYRRRIVEEDPIVIVPVGAVEQHGPHLPTGTDTLIPAGLATRATSRIGDHCAETRTILAR